MSLPFYRILQQDGRLLPIYGPLRGKPAPPVGVSSVHLGASTIVSWSAAAGAVSYQVYRSTDDITYVLLGSTVAPTVEYSDSSDRAASTLYYYKVTVTTGAGVSDLSAATSITTYRFFDTFLRAIGPAAVLPGVAASGQSWAQYTNAPAVVRFGGDGDNVYRDDASGGDTSHQYYIAPTANLDLQAYFSYAGEYSGLAWRLNNNGGQQWWFRSYISGTDRLVTLSGAGANQWTANIGAGTQGEAIYWRALVEADAITVYYKRTYGAAWTAANATIENATNNTILNHGMHLSATGAFASKVEWIIDVR